MLFDLGVSSPQLDEGERGFAYSSTPRWTCGWTPTPGADRRRGRQHLSAEELARVLRVYGEERFASRIAAADRAGAGREPFTTTDRLAELVRTAIPAATRRTGGNPAKRTFQALRIEVNDELRRPGAGAARRHRRAGRRWAVVVITFHSLEDRIVKQTLAARTADRPRPGCRPPAGSSSRGSAC